MRRIVEQMVELIVRCCDPDEVLLFGSHAKGTPTRDSDVDLLVLCETPNRRALQHEIADLLAPFPIGVDVHILATSRVDEEWADRGSFIQSILASAVPVHVRSAPSRLAALRGPESLDSYTGERMIGGVERT
jgi:uncharacterized protein